MFILDGLLVLDMVESVIGSQPNSAVLIDKRSAGTVQLFPVNLNRMRFKSLGIYRVDPRRPGAHPKTILTQWDDLCHIPVTYTGLRSDFFKYILFPVIFLKPLIKATAPNLILNIFYKGIAQTICSVKFISIFL